MLPFKLILNLFSFRIDTVIHRFSDDKSEIFFTILSFKDEDVIPYAGYQLSANWGFPYKCSHLSIP